MPSTFYKSKSTSSLFPMMSENTPDLELRLRQSLRPLGGLNEERVSQLTVAACNAFNLKALSIVAKIWSERYQPKPFNLPSLDYISQMFGWEAVEPWLKMGADPAGLDKLGRSQILLFVLRKEHSNLKNWGHYLKSPQVIYRKNVFPSALFFAQDAQSVQILLSQGAVLNEKFKATKSDTFPWQGETPLTVAFMEDKTEVFNELIKAGALLNDKDTQLTDTFQRLISSLNKNNNGLSQSKKEMLENFEPLGFNWEAKTKEGMVFASQLNQVLILQGDRLWFKGVLEPMRCRAEAQKLNLSLPKSLTHPSVSPPRL